MRMLFLAAVLAISSTAGTSAQEFGESLYVGIDYGKANTNQPVQTETKTWAPFWQAMVDAGHRESWTMYNVWWGFDNSYTHVWVHTAKSMADFDIPDAEWDSLWAVAHPGKDIDSLLAAWPERFDFVRSEFWRIDASAGDLHGEMLSLGFMDVPEGGGQEYVAVERDLWKPMKSLQAADGGLEGWAVLGKWWPGGTDYPYDYVAVNSVQSFEAFETATPMTEYFPRAHPNMTPKAIMDRTLASRSIVRSELWQRQLHAH